MLNSVVIPLMAGNRIAKCGKVDPYEIHKTETYITTASTRQQFAYEKWQEIDSDMMNGESAFVIVNGYELPCMHDRLDIDFVEEKRNSPTYSILDFMREYSSIYTGSSTDALVSDDKLNKSRKVMIAEWEHCGDKDIEYVLSYDVARTMGVQSALSSLSVIKLTPRNDGTYIKEVVNVFSRPGEHDTHQALFLKEQVRLFKPTMLVVDANGIGGGVVDRLIEDLGDGNPPYAVVNDEDYEKYHTDDSIPILYALKSQKKETKEGDMNNHFMKCFNNSDISLLTTPEAGAKAMVKKRILDVKDMGAVYEAQVPYYYTNNLCEEILNLRYKQAGTDTKIEQISRSIPKDKFSALKYGMYWIYLLEMKNKEQKKTHNFMNYVMY